MMSGRGGEFRGGKGGGGWFGEVAFGLREVGRGGEGGRQKWR